MPSSAKIATFGPLSARHAWTRLAVLVVGVAVDACSPGRPPSHQATATGPGADDAVPLSVELRRPPKCPAIHLVARSGDPMPAVAVAVAHDAGPVASAALAGLLDQRLAAHGLRGVELEVHALGLELQHVVRSPEDAANFVAIVSDALRTPVSESDPGLKRARRRVDALRNRNWIGTAQSQMAECSGEAGIPAQAEPPSDASLEGWRSSVFSSGATAFAAVGPQPVLDAAARALAKTRPWPSSPQPDDVWPDADQIVTGTGLNARQLSVALRVADGGTALAAARQLGMDPTLAQRLATVGDGWKVDHVATTLRPRGACLRVDLAGPEGPQPEAETIATLALVAADELQRALAAPTDGAFALRQALLSPSDPRDAAGAAAWQALVGQRDPGETRRYVAYLGSKPDSVPDLERTLPRLERSWRRPSVEVRHRLEPGQGEVWALLASSCGTAAETADTAGHGGLVVRALADGAPSLDGVTLEPWVTADGIGLLAHGPRLDPSETAEQHANRMGEALGRALSRPLAGNEVARARAEVQHLVGPGPRPGWWLTVNALAPGHPSWLEPLGTWQSVVDAATRGVTERRVQLASGPLRLAVIANVEREQAAAVAQGVDRWLRPMRRDATACPSAPVPTARSGQAEIETSSGPEIAAAHVAVPLGPNGSGLPDEAHFTLWLLNREGGWLDRALQQPGLVAGARAALLGGRRAGALVVSLEATPDQAEQAVAQLRALFARLAAGAASKQDLARAQTEFERGAARSELDPRRRVVGVWQGIAAGKPTLQSLRSFHARVFAADQHVVVLVKQRD